MFWKGVAALSSSPARLDRALVGIKRYWSKHDKLFTWSAIAAWSASEKSTLFIMLRSSEASTLSREASAEKGNYMETSNGKWGEDEQTHGIHQGTCKWIHLVFSHPRQPTHQTTPQRNLCTRPVIICLTISVNPHLTSSAGVMWHPNIMVGGLRPACSWRKDFQQLSYTCLIS